MGFAASAADHPNTTLGGRAGHPAPATSMFDVVKTLTRPPADPMPAPAQPDELNGVRVGVRYLSADRSAGTGGDWYLTVPLPGGDVMLAVGDVMGHGPAAARTMERLRAAMVALALEGDEPRELLGALNRMLCRSGTTTMATAVCGRYSPRTRELTWARAGHLPILRAGATGSGRCTSPAAWPSAWTRRRATTRPASGCTGASCC